MQRTQSTLGVVLRTHGSGSCKFIISVNGAASATANPEKTELISRVIKKIFRVKVVSVTGNLISELCKSKTKGASTATCWIFYVTFPKHDSFIKDNS